MQYHRLCGCHGDDVAGGTVVYANQVWIIPLNIPLIKPTAFQLTASQVPAITVISENESLRYQGLTNTSLGNATMVISNTGSGGPALVVSNLGSSGQDGVSIALSPGTSFAGGWLPLDPSNSLPVGAYVESQIIGTAGGVTNGVLGTTTCTKMGTSNYVIAVDYSRLGSSSHTVQVYNGATLVAQVTGQSGLVCATRRTSAGHLHDQSGVEHGMARSHIYSD